MHPWKSPMQTGERLCALFETAIGHCGLAWGSMGLTHVLLGGSDAEHAGERLRWESDAEFAPPPWPEFVTTAAAGMQALLRGERGEDFAEVLLDWTGIGSFEREVYEATRRIAVGRLVTCDKVAELMGAPGNTRAVDVALGRNPWPLIVPSHRVLSLRDERLGGPQDAGMTIRGRLLAIEAALVQRTA